MSSDPRAAFLRAENARRLVPAVLDILCQREPADVAYLLREIARQIVDEPENWVNLAADRAATDKAHNG